MKTDLEKAIRLIEEWKISDFFDFVKSKKGENELLNRLAKRFMTDHHNEDYDEQLRLLATWLLSEDPKESKKAGEALTEKGTIMKIEIEGNNNQVFQNVQGSTIHTGTGHIIKGDYKKREINIGEKGKYIEKQYNLPQDRQAPSINIHNQNDNNNMIKQENFGNASVSGSGNSTNTNINKNINSQTIDFELLEQKLPDFQSELDSFKKELKRALNKTQDATRKGILEDLVTEADEILSDSKEVKNLAKNKDEDELKSKGFWKDVAKFVKKVSTSVKDLLNPESIQNLGKSASEIAKIADACGINTGFDYANYGSE
jgi:endonuclease III